MKTKTLRELTTAIAALMLSACSSAGSMTCSEYSQLDAAGREAALDDLLSEHDLAVIHAGNQMGVADSVNQFCGVSASFGDQDVKPATQNLDRTLDESTDWESSTW